MDIKVHNGYVKVSCVDEDGFVRDFITYNDELFDFVSEVFGDIDRLDYEKLPNPLKSIILNCIDGKFIQIVAKPDTLEKQLKDFGLAKYYKYDGEVFKFSPKILNYIVYKEKEPQDRGKSV